MVAPRLVALADPSRRRWLLPDPGHNLDHRGRSEWRHRAGASAAYADELARRKLAVRLKVVAFGGVRESAEALRDGKADLAVVRPDVALPGNGLTLAVLRELAAWSWLQCSGIKTIPDSRASDWVCWPDGRRIGRCCEISSPTMVLKLLTDPPTIAVGGKSVALVPVEESDVAAAFRDGRIDAMALVTTPNPPDRAAGGQTRRGDE